MLDQYRQWWHSTNRSWFSWLIVRNKPTQQLLHTRLCLASVATILWMISSDHQLRTWLTLSGGNQMLLQRHSTCIQVDYQQQTQISHCLKWCFKGRLTYCSDTLKRSEITHVVALWITSKRWMLIRMWLCYVSTITLWMHSLWAPQPIRSVQAVTQQRIHCCEDRMHRRDGCSIIWIEGGYIAGSLEVGEMGDNLGFLVRFWVTFSVLFI